MSKEKHGILGSTIKIVMVIVFFLVGALILTAGILGLTIWKSDVPTWVAGCNVGFGACLLLSPIFLNHKRGGLISIIKIVMVIVFVLIGILFIVVSAISLARNYQPTWYYIVEIVFGCLLFTSPFFLKKDIAGKKAKQE